jgi:hypothetical protein
LSIVSVALAEYDYFSILFFNVQLLPLGNGVYALPQVIVERAV